MVIVRQCKEPFVVNFACGSVACGGRHGQRLAAFRAGAAAVGAAAVKLSQN
jgi:hypothetical protein